jgi:hypothetical protein
VLAAELAGVDEVAEEVADIQRISELDALINL